MGRISDLLDGSVTARDRDCDGLDGSMTDGVMTNGDGSMTDGVMIEPGLTDLAVMTLYGEQGGQLFLK